MLAHAEVEAFVEDVALSKVEARYAEWQNSHAPSLVVLSLVAASAFGWADDETEQLRLPTLSLSKLDGNADSINVVVDRAVRHYRQIVSDNHGIKRGNLKRLLMPLGVALGDLDQTWLNTMDGFGGKRGSVAHSSRIGLKSVPNPKDEFATVSVVALGLKDLDGRIAAL